MNALHLQTIQSCQQYLQALEKMCPADRLAKQIDRLDARLSAAGLWDDPKVAAGLMKERMQLSELMGFLLGSGDDLSLYQEIISTSELGDKDFAQLISLHNQLKGAMYRQMLQDPVDTSPAIITISAGAGGLEAANWVSMLYRMYLRYADSYGFKHELLDHKASDEHSSICTDTVSIRLEGNYAYGFLKGESGVHRLIRNSPFNAAGARQTSFAAVYVSPDIEDTIEVVIREEDLEITAQTAGGPGGQHSNKVSSAIRLKHKPTGINIFVRAERDQHSNRRTAMKMLKSKLYELEILKRKEALDQTISQQSDISFGHQIRTYTETPYSLVKDHRTDHEVNDFDRVLEGDIESFIMSYLQHQAK